MQANTATNPPIKHKHGYGLRLSFAIFLIVPALAMTIAGIVFVSSAMTYEYNSNDTLYMGYILTVVGAFAAIICVLAFIGAVKGRTARWANILSIVTGSILCFTLFGILAIIGGIKGKRVIDNSELKDYIPYYEGYGQRLAFAIVITFITIIVLLVGSINSALGDQEIFAPVLYAGCAMAVVTALSFVGAIKGKTSISANVLSIALGALFCPLLIGILAVIGGVKGKNFIQDGSTEEIAQIINAERLAKKQSAKPPRNVINVNFDCDNVGKTVVIVNGESFINTLNSMANSGRFNEFEFEYTDNDISMSLTCLGFTTVNRYGKDRLYIAYKYNNSDEKIYVAYVVRLNNGKYASAEEPDENMVLKVSDAFSNIDYNSKQKSYNVAVKKASSSGGIC